MMGYVTSQSRGEANNIWFVVSKICVFFSNNYCAYIYNMLYIYIYMYIVNHNYIIYIYILHLGKLQHVTNVFNQKNGHQRGWCLRENSLRTMISPSRLETAPRNSVPNMFFLAYGFIWFIWFILGSDGWLYLIIAPHRKLVPLAS